MVFLSKAMFLAVKSTLTAGPEAVGVAVVVAGTEDVAGTELVAGIVDIVGVEDAGVVPGDVGVVEVGAVVVAGGVDAGVVEDEQPTSITQTISKARIVDPPQILNEFFM
jgi:hypothetical protein